MADYNQDYLLDKQIKIFQPLNGYHASTDAVLLAAFVSHINPKDNILDVGSGTGAVSLCLAERFKNYQPQICGIEIQPELVELSNLSAEANGFNNLHYLNVDIGACPLPNCSFAHVITNPPYSEADLPSPNVGKATAHNFSNAGLKEWIDFCIKMIKPRGYFYMVNRAAALEAILAQIHGRLGAIEVLPLYSKVGQKAKRVLIRARKDSKAPLSVLPGMYLHQPDGAYTAEAEKVLREGWALSK